MSKVVSVMNIKLVSYSKQWKAYFESLNRLWLETYFEVEPIDELVFQDPESYIIQPGGQIFFILDQEIPVGTCAIIPLNTEEFELSKMSVDPSYRYQGYGAKLMEVAIDFARKAGANQISLITDTKLPQAIRLYQRYGFQMIPYTPDPRYKRGNIRMKLSLT